MKKSNTRFLAEAGLIAALYAVTTYFCALWGLAYGEVQFRLSEALTILPLFTPAASPGLAIGCLIANLGSPMGLVDIVCGTAATLIAAIAVWAVRRVRIKNIPWLAPLFPVLANAIVVGLEISWFMPEGLSWAGFAAAAVSVGLGELVVCYGLGLPLSIVLDRLPMFQKKAASC